MTDFVTHRFGNCEAHNTDNTGGWKYRVRRNNADIGLLIESETQACLLAALIEGLDEKQWLAIKRKVNAALGSKQKAAA